MKQPVFENFPKHREALPAEYLAVYERHYKRNRQGATKATSLSMKMERWLHVKVAEDAREGTGSNRATLEIGAGMLNQLPFEPGVVNYDIVEPFEELYRGSVHLGRVRSVYADIGDIPAGTAYSRITSVAAFEHIGDLPVVVAKVATLLEKKGSLRVAIPNEGTILWKLGTLITGYEFRHMYGLDYQVLMKYEHVNTADEIEAVLKYFFNSVSTRVFGISRRLAFYRFFRCTGPEVEKAKEYLEGLTDG